MTDTPPRLAAALADRYRLERKLGEGGMATVYLAHDLRHERKVALKVLKPELAALVGADRFLAEIKTTANLQHPHILGLYDSGEADGLLFYVMPYVEGESLRDRLDREHQLPVDDAVRIATNLAEALDYAHRKSVIHRDIKPANILLQDGKPVIADFGIALAVSEAGGGRLTETGLSLGTPHYMSPEQATGDLTVGPQADIYALGCVLYEMLVGDPPHTASSAQGVLAKILTEDARSPTGSRPSIPPNVDAAVRKALERVPADRFRSAEAFARALGDPGFRHGDPRGPEGMAAPSMSRGRMATHALLVATLAAVALWGWLRPGVDATSEATPVRMALPDFQFSQNTDLRPVISGDGSFLVVHGPDEDAPYLMRPADRRQFSEISGTEGGREATISPDGRWLAFRRGIQILRVELPGGAPLPVAEGYDPHWSTQETIVFGTLEGEIYAVSPQGGDPVPLLSEDEPARGSHPHLLPGGEALVFQGRRPGDPGTAPRLLLLDLASGLATDLGIEGANPAYIQSGHLLFTRGDQSLMAVPFDPERREVTGTPFTTLTGILDGGEQGDAAVSVSNGGTAVYLRGAGQRRQLVERGLDGSESTLPLGVSDYRHPRYSPDGRYIAYEQGVGLWVYDRETGANERFTEGQGRYPVWSPDGSYLYYSPSWQELARKRTDGSSEPERLHGQDGFVFPTSISPSGEAVVLAEWIGPERGLNMLIFTPGGEEGRTRSFLRAAHHEMGGEISPDGAWVAYGSDESGGRRVYLRRLEDASGQIEVSGVDGGGWPQWVSDGSALYYVKIAEEDTLLVRAPVSMNGLDGLAVGTPEAVLPIPYMESDAPFGGRNWDLSPDGTRLVMVSGIEGESSSTGATAEIVVNWFAEVRALEGG